MPAVVIEPAPGPRGVKEAESFFIIGTHLFSRGVPVPEIYYFERDSGWLVVEDLGDKHVQDEALFLLSEGNMAGFKQLYARVLGVLVLMQEKGSPGFNASWCWQGPIYDSRLAMEKEGLYFLKAFLKGYMELSFSEEILVRELAELSGLVDDYGSQGFILHRDFQSRNLMICQEKIMIIDFQAARLGPPAYDLASVLHDPYVNMPWNIRQELYHKYLELTGRTAGDKGFGRQFHLFSILRLLQALGAYGFLTKVKKRYFFRSFMKPALEGLERLLQDWHHTDCRELRRCIHAAMARPF